MKTGRVNALRALCAAAWTAAPRGAGGHDARKVLAELGL